MKPKSEVGIKQVLHRFLPQLLQEHHLCGHQRSILKLMQLCKTSALGGHKEMCNSCHHTKIHYNSCGNRHCPNCQGVNKEIWIHARLKDLLPVTYFHTVFTIPSELYQLFSYNKRLLYSCQMNAVRQTLLALGHDPKHDLNGQIGGICIQHTWTQQMTYHPHIHCIVPAGAMSKQGAWTSSKGKGNFLFPVRVMSGLYKGKLMAMIHEQFKAGQLTLPKSMSTQDYTKLKRLMYTKGFNVYAKKAFGGPDQILEYLGRYTHKICISNHRILKMTKTHVTFRYTDRKKNQLKCKTICGVKFLKLFAEHILPKRFVKIRHIGFLAPRFKARNLKSIRKHLKVCPPEVIEYKNTRDFITATTGIDPHLCPKCHKGEMVIISMLTRIRGSPYPDPDIKIYTRPIPAYRKVELR